MKYGVGLTAILVVLWLTLSGHFTTSGNYPLLMVQAVLSVAAAVALTIRMRILDSETVPLGRLLPMLPYWGWLGGEIVSANIAVLKLIMKPEVDIEPRMVHVPVDMRSGLGRCVFANSITLTPGTVTVDIDDDGFLIHALDKSLTDSSGFADMQTRSDLASDGKQGARS